MMCHHGMSISMAKSFTLGLIPILFHAALAGFLFGLQDGGFTLSICSTRFSVFSTSFLKRFFAGIFQPFCLVMWGSCLCTGINATNSGLRIFSKASTNV